MLHEQGGGRWGVMVRTCSKIIRTTGRESFPLVWVRTFSTHRNACCQGYHEFSSCTTPLYTSCLYCKLGGIRDCDLRLGLGDVGGEPVQPCLRAIQREGGNAGSQSVDELFGRHAVLFTSARRPFSQAGQGCSEHGPLPWIEEDQARGAGTKNQSAQRFTPFCLVHDALMSAPKS
jgi:hypothetical protein